MKIAYPTNSIVALIQNIELISNSLWILKAIIDATNWKMIVKKINLLSIIIEKMTIIIIDGARYIELEMISSFGNSYVTINEVKIYVDAINIPIIEPANNIPIVPTLSSLIR